MTKHVGIDIGGSSIKVATLSQTKKGPYIESLDVFPLPIDPNSDRELAILEVLQRIRETNVGHDCLYFFSVPQSKVAFRYKTFPFVEKLKIIKALPFELEEDLPFALENAFWSTRIIRQVGNESNVLTAAVTQIQIKKFMDSVGSLGLNIKKIIPQGNALHNILAPLNEMTWRIPSKVTDESKEEKKKLKLVLDIGHKETIVNLYEDNMWINSSVILWGGYNLVKTISTRYELGLEDALKVVKEKSFVLIQLESVSYEQIVFSETLAAELKYLTKELNLIILGFENSHNGAIGDIHVTGGTSRLINLSPFLTQQLEIPVNQLSYLDQWHYSPNIDIHIEPFAANAIGLAIEGFKKNTQPQFQFLQGIFAQKNQYFEKFWLSAKDSVLWGSAILVTLWVWSSLRVSFSSDLVAKVNDKVREAGQIVADLPAKQANQIQIRNYIKNARAVIIERQLFDQTTQKASALDVLKWISEKFPEKVNSTSQVSELIISDASIKMKATTGSAEEKSRILSLLRNMSAGQNIQDLNPSNPLSLDIEFNLKNRDK